MPEVLSWKQVVAYHGVIAGISVNQGVVKSLLCSIDGDSQYPNSIDDHEIKYYVGPSTQSHGIKALISSLSCKRPFKVFQKISVNNWVDLGYYLVSDMKHAKNRQHIEFKLVPDRATLN
jgi:hypothetical protein